MKSLKESIEESLEVNESTVYVAIEDVMEPNTYYPKGTRSYRVVSLDTWEKLRRGEKTNYGEHTYTELGRSSNKEIAQSFLPSSQKTARKSKIDKKGADYIVYCISSGKMNAGGNTNWDWNFWEEWKGSEIYMDKWGRSFLIGAPGSLKVGDTVFCVDNDTQKKLSGAPSVIGAVCKCDLEEFRKEFRKKFPSQCKKPSFSFGKRHDGLPWVTFGQIYSIKGIADE